ncbi:MAG: type I 3-dehydroquinate dehydratase [Lachnospiraceae bacterium]|nr:type I 3-dehydroquinate dehydratase [Lachnospiraceae bacterium]
MPVIVKGRYIDNNKPLVCVPIVETTKEAILSRTRDLVDSDVEMLEWRADFYEDLADIEKVKSLLETMRGLTKDTVLVVTIRSLAQGGQCKFSPLEISNTLVSMSGVHAADFIDVEFFTFEKPERLIKKLQERGALVITSHHDFRETPEESVMMTLLEQMKEGDADIVKLAVMPREVSDVLSLLKVTDLFRKENPSIPVVTMSMGRMGMISRIAGEIFGSCITFGSVGALSAPGQMPREELERVLSFIHKYYGDKNE